MLTLRNGLLDSPYAVAHDQLCGEPDFPVGKAVLLFDTLDEELRQPSSDSCGYDGDIGWLHIQDIHVLDSTEGADGKGAWNRDIVGFAVFQDADGELIVHGNHRCGWLIHLHQLGNAVVACGDLAEIAVE